MSHVKYDKKESVFNMTSTPELILKPVYVMTYQYMHQKYVYTINGQTMKMYGEIPLDRRKLNLVTLLLACLIFGLILGLSYLNNAPKNLIEEQSVRSNSFQASEIKAEAFTPLSEYKAEAFHSLSAVKAEALDPSSETGASPLLAKSPSLQVNRGTSRPKRDWEQAPDLASESGPPKGSWDGTDPVS